LGSDCDREWSKDESDEDRRMRVVISSEESSLDSLHARARVIVVEEKFGIVRGEEAE